MRFARLRFVVGFGVAAAAALAAQAAGFEPGFAVALAVAGLAWVAMQLDEVRGARRASADRRAVDLDRVSLSLGHR